MPKIFSKTYNYKKLKIAKIRASKKYFLITVFVSSCIAIGVSLFTPKYQDRPKFQLPDRVSLNEWRSLPSEDLTSLLKEPTKAVVADARKYLYTSPTQDVLRIDVLYVKEVVVIPKFLEILDLQYSINNLDIRHQKNIGYYALFNDRERAYLSACINPRGLSTVTQEHIISNRNDYDFTPDRVINYLLGITYIRDNRCLLTAISLPLENKQNQDLNNTSLNNSYQKLEKVWINWYQKWENNFPKV